MRLLLMVLSTSAHLGDCLWVVMMLARMAGEHQFYVNKDYVEQLRPLLSHTQHQVLPLEQWDNSGFDCWIANGQFEHLGLFYRGEPDIMGFVYEYFNYLSLKMGEPKPIFASRNEMIFDVPAIPKPELPKIIDVLIINSDPMSGQCMGYSRSELAEKVVVPLKKKWGKVITTNHADNTPVGFSLKQIGILSTIAERIIAVANGPFWPAVNRWTIDTEKLVFLHPMRLEYGTKITHVTDAAHCVAKCERLGWL